ncbi:MAG: NHL repeat-containing protein [Candidatus Zixiibacteriota bacterium]|nr:MAG: NHL repeat-containing protein [candidate division Zixibacteria bacterium]
MKSAFHISSNLIIFLLLLLTACAGTGRLNRDYAGNIADEKILNVHSVESVGPSMGDEINLMKPFDITVNPLGDIYVSDNGLNMVLKLNEELEVISYEGGIGGGLGDFNRPAGMACDAALNLYVADPGNNRIQILDRNLRQATVRTEYFGNDGSASKFSRPEDVAIDFEGNMWVADDDRVLKINPFNEIELELSYSSPVGLNIGKAVSIAATGTGIIAIGDSGNKKVFVVSSYGNLISEFQVGSISSVAWEGKDIIWISSPINERISAYDIYGNRLFSFADKSPGTRPMSVAVDKRGMLLVADAGLKKISRYEILRSLPDQSE